MTISLDEATYRQARIMAAERGMSASALVRDLLTRLQPAQNRPAALTLAETFTWASPGYKAAARYTREEVNDRALVRAEHEAALKASQRG